MKKILFTLILMLPFVFYSCSDEEGITTSSLDGTIWEYHDNEVEGLEAQFTLKFSKTTFTFTGYEIIFGDREDYSGSGTYEYNHPVVTFTEGGETGQAIISGNKMTMDGEDGIVYTKK